MARKRMISPEFFLHEELAELPALHRLLFIGLWTEADREGRLEDRPRRLKVAILPYDDCDMDAMLGKLAERGFVIRYEVGGSRYVAIPGFPRHQSPHIKEAASEIPPPPAGSPQEPSRRPEAPAPCEPRASLMLATGGHESSRPDTDTDTDLDPDTDLGLPDPGRLTPSAFVALWNERTGGRLPGPPEGKRLTGIQRCLKRRSRPEDWEQVWPKAKALRATGECGWLDLDWLVRDVSHADRIESGAFDFKLGRTATTPHAIDHGRPPVADEYRNLE